MAGEALLVRLDMRRRAMARRRLGPVAQQVAGNAAEIGLRPVEVQPAPRLEPGDPAEDILNEVKCFLAALRPALKRAKQPRRFCAIEGIEAERSGLRLIRAIVLGRR